MIRPPRGRLTLLLHAEQGFGDVIQFIRYLPQAAQRGGKIVLECQSELQRLLQAMAPDVPVVARGQTLPPFDIQCPLLSLPRLFATDLTNIPHNVPSCTRSPFRPGMAGAGGGQSHSETRPGLGRRPNPRGPPQIPQSGQLAPIAKVPGVRFYSLQKGPPPPRPNPRRREWN